MRLESTEGHTLELRIVGYQFPGNEPEEFDLDWLFIQGTVGHPRGAWSFLDPSLLTCEVAELAEWLEGVATGRPSADGIDFTEPNLKFGLVGDTSDRRLRIDFAQEARPPWSRPGVTGAEDSSIQFRLAAIDLLEAAASLRSQLASHPQRAQR